MACRLLYRCSIPKVGEGTHVGVVGPNGRKNSTSCLMDSDSDKSSRSCVTTCHGSGICWGNTTSCYSGGACIVVIEPAATVEYTLATMEPATEKSPAVTGELV